MCNGDTSTKIVAIAPDLQDNDIESCLPIDRPRQDDIHARHMG